MLCAQCGHLGRPGAKFCGQCGAPLDAEPTPAGRSAVSNLANAEHDLLGILDDVTVSLDRELAELTDSLTPTGMPVGSESPRGLVHPYEMQALLQTDPNQLNQSATFVFQSPFIQGNALYRSRIASVTFGFFSEDPTVNAFATDHPVPLPGGKQVEPPAIVFFEGLATAGRLAAAALAMHLRSRGGDVSDANSCTLPDFFRQLGRTILRDRGRLAAKPAMKLLAKLIAPALLAGEERFISLARSYAAAMDMFVVAHEAGHLALGHTLGQQQNFDVSRNQEREADSFASSALSTSPFREYLFLGQVFVTIVFAWAEAASQHQEASTHPLSRERFMNALQANSTAAAEAAQDFGLTRDRLLELLPP